MRIGVDISDGLFRRISTIIDRGAYASFSAFAVVALENQVSLDAVVHEPSTIAAQRQANSRSAPDPGRPVSSVTSQEAIAQSDSAVKRTVSEYGWLWGIVNRVFPIKIAVR